MNGMTGWGEFLRFTPPLAGPGAGLSASGRIGLDRLEFYLACAAVFLAPLNSLRHPSIYITLSDVFAFACFFVMLVNRSLPLNPLGSCTPPWMFGIVMLTGGLLASSIVNGSMTRGLIVSAQYGAAFFILPFVIVSRPWPQVVFLIKTHVFVIFFLCVHGIYLIHIVGETHTPYVTGTGRLMSFMERQNAFASVIAMTFPLVLWLAGVGSIRRVTVWITLPMLMYGVMLTGSASGVFATIYVFGIYFLVAISTSWRRLLVGLGGLAAFVTMLGAWGATLGRAYLPAVFQKRVLGALESGDIDQAGTFSHRYELMVEAMQIVDDTIILGLGADQYRVVSQWEQPVHNAYLLIWSEGGLIALIGFLLVAFGGLIAVPGAMRRPGGRFAAVCTFCAVTQFAFLVNAIPHVYARFWMMPVLLGIAVSIAYAREGAVPGWLRGLAGERRRRGAR